MTRIDRYLLAEAMRRLALALGIVLLALVLERVMRIFEFAADNGAAISTVLQMTASLVPHYLGLALPAAFFISVLLLVARLGDDSELDAMMGAGLSVRRIARPLVFAAMLLTVFSTLLYGWIEPYSRYGYRALRHAATHGAWTGAIEAKTFFTPSNGLTIYAAEVDLSGRDLTDVFVRQVGDDGTEIVTTAATGQIVLVPDSDLAQVTLQDVVQVVTAPGQNPATFRLQNFRVDPSFPMEPTPYRDRGAEERELTLPELWQAMDPETDSQAGTADERAAEFHGRLASALSILVLPFLAIPMGMSAKRQRRGVAIGMAAIILVLYQNMLELGGGLVAKGAIPGLIGQWLPFAVFTAVSLWLFRRVDGGPRAGLFDALFDGIERGFAKLARPFRRRRKETASP